MAKVLSLKTAILVPVFVLGIVLVRHVTMATTDSLAIESVTATRVPCSQQATINSTYSTLLGQRSCKNAVHCVALCSSHGKCLAAAFVQVTDASSTCLLLGGISATKVSLPEGKTCSMYILNPCPAGSHPFRGQCRCPNGTAGQFCQLTNPGDCTSGWSKVYRSDGNAGNSDVIINANKANKGGYAKVGVHKINRSVQVFHGMFFYADIGTTFACQATPVLLRETRLELKDFPPQRYRFISSDGTMQSFTEHDNTKINENVVTEWFMRQPHVTRLVYSCCNNGQVVTGSVDDLIKVVLAGQEILNHNAVRVQTTPKLVVTSRFEYELSRSGRTYRFQASSYWLHNKHTSGGKRYCQRFFIVSDSFGSRSTYNAKTEFHADVCWTPADLSRSKDHNVGQLLAAVLNGHRVRVLVGEVALTVDQVEVAGDEVVFGALPYLDPLDDGPYTDNSEVVWTAAVTDLRVMTCRAKLPSSSTVSSTVSNAAVRWFVDTRPRSRVYSVTWEGKVEHGSEEGLYEALLAGASLTLGLLFPEPNHYLLLTIKTVDLISTDGPIVAMVEGLSRLPITNGRVTSELDCGLRAFLVTSRGSVEQYEYQRRTQGSHSILSNVTIDWFVDTYTTL